MEKTIIILLLLHFSISAPVNNDKINYQVDLDNGQITYESDPKDQSYAYRVETYDGTIKHEKGTFVDNNAVVEGAYEYVGDNGLVHSVTYIADKNGYRPRVSFGTAVKSRPAQAPIPAPVRPPAKQLSKTIKTSFIGGGVRRRFIQLIHL